MNTVHSRLENQHHRAKTSPNWPIYNERNRYCHPETIDGTSIGPHLFWSYLSGETPKELVDGITAPSKSRVWRSVVDSTIKEI